MSIKDVNKAATKDTYPVVRWFIAITFIPGMLVAAVAVISGLGNALYNGDPILIGIIIAFVCLMLCGCRSE